MEMTRMGYSHDDSILPMVGNDPFSRLDSESCQLVTSCEIYKSSKDKIIIIQQRAPFVKGKRRSFRRKLVEWIKKCGFDQVVILTSSYAHERVDKQLSGSQQRYLASPKMTDRLDNLVREKLQWKCLEKRIAFPAPSSIDQADTRGQESVYIPGGGIAKALFEDCYNDVAVLLVLTFCAEGDNAPDAVQLANYINQYLQVLPQEEPSASETSEGQRSPMWKIPSSWRLTFGNQADPMLFH
ncbi:proteasome assembly chaperone 2-like isoform X2 [Liolophura sinensis]